MTEYIVDGDCLIPRLEGLTLQIHFKTNGEIVRCRDCKHVKYDPEWQPDRRFKPVDLWTCHAEWCEGFEGDHPQVEPDGFCKWGERK